MFIQGIAIAQTIKVEYCEVTAYQKAFSPKYIVKLNSGTQHEIIKDSTGMAIEFDTPIQSLNYMAKSGWVLSNLYVQVVSGTNVYVYILKREVL